MSPSLLVPFIKSLFLKEIILLRDVDTGKRTAEYLLQKQLEHLVRGSVERVQNEAITRVYILSWYIFSNLLVKDTHSSLEKHCKY